MTVTIEQLEEQVKGQKAAIEFRNLILKLYSNREFQKVIVQGFMVEECARYVQLSCDPNIPADSRADALATAQAAGYLKRFLEVHARMGDNAENTLTQLNAAIEELRLEETE